MSGVINKDAMRAMDTMRWLWEYFAARNWRRPPRLVDLDYQKIVDKIDAYVLAYLKAVNPAGRAWPKDAVCPIRLREYLLQLLPALMRAGRGLLTDDEIAKIDDVIIDYSIMMANNGVSALPLCIAAEQLWQQASRGSD